MKLKSKKSALLMSFTSLLLCFAMLAGSTFAWFTDTATTGVNKIVAGKLDVGLEMKDADNNWVDAEGETLTFKTKDSRPADEIFWEPGCTYELPELRIVNKGNLALKYKVEITGIRGDAKLNEVIEWTIVEGETANEVKKEGVATGEYFLLPAGQTTAPLTIKGEMDKNAGNEYQNLTIDGIGITVLATQYTHEKDSIDDQYDKDAAYAQGAYIVGLTDENEKTVTFDTLTAAAKAWRESKNIVTSGGNMGQHPAELTSVDTISWIISGKVNSGDGTGVNGSSGNLLSGGYIYPRIEIKNIYVKGVNNAELKNEIVTPSSDALSAAAKNVVYDGITFPEYMCFNTKAENVTFKNCTFKGGLKVMQAVNVTVDHCKIEGDGTKDYAFFAQGTSLKKIDFKNNTVSGFMRGLNIQAGDAAVTISNNTIQNITGKTENGNTYGAAIQLTSAKTFTVTGNNISNVAVNALHIWAGTTDKCNPDSIVIKDNTISAAYLCWNQADYDMSKVTSSGNTVNVTNSGKCVTKTAEEPSTFTLN